MDGRAQGRSRENTAVVHREVLGLGPPWWGGGEIGDVIKVNDRTY